MSTAFIFPGQGGQFVGQGRAWLEQDPSLQNILNMAEELSGRPLGQLCFEGPIEQLSQTVNLQPAILAVSLMALRLARRESQPDFTAGHSLGEFAALCAAEVFSEETALNLVVKRALYMDEAARQNPGSMLAVLGLKAKEVESICELARNEGLVAPANFNTPEQVVISGESRAVAAAGKYVKLKNGKAIALPVSGAFHSPMMDEAARRFAAELEKVDFKNPVCPVVPNSLGRPISDPAEIKALLLSQMVSPVRWTTTVESLAAAGVTEFKEMWPKAYLGSLVKKCLPKGSPIAVTFQP